MIRGTSGSGKTSLVKTLIERVYMDCRTMMCKFSHLDVHHKVDRHVDESKRIASLQIVVTSTVGNTLTIVWTYSSPILPNGLMTLRGIPPPCLC
jgi:molybdopterin-guanine dinucleotide biosynthesis protein